jgi:hypothetical protein
LIDPKWTQPSRSLNARRTQTTAPGRFADTLPLPLSLKGLIPGTSEHESAELAHAKRDAIGFAAKIEKAGIADKQLQNALCKEVNENAYLLNAVNNELKNDGMHLTFTNLGTANDLGTDDNDYKALTLSKTEKAGQSVIANVEYVTNMQHYGGVLPSDSSFNNGLPEVGTIVPVAVATAACKGLEDWKLKLAPRKFPAI